MPTFGPSPRRFQGQGTRRLPQGLYGSEDQTTTLTSAFCTGRGLRKNPDLPSITGNVDPTRLDSFPVPVLHALTVNGTSNCTAVSMGRKSHIPARVNRLDMCSWINADVKR